MSQDMPSSWRSLASARSRLTSLKSYLSNPDLASGSRSPRITLDGSANTRDTNQGWRAWAGQKIRARRGNAAGYINTEVVNIFPGWAARKYPTGLTLAEPLDGPKPFELHVFVSGYAISHRPPESAGRAQRAFMRLAKGYAYLPKLILGEDGDTIPKLARLSPSTEALLASVKLPPRPTEITDDYNVEELERQLRRAKEANRDDNSETSSPSSSTDNLSSLNGPGQTPTPPSYITSINGSTPSEVIRRLHANLEQRLQPFWSSVLANRTIRLHLFASPHQDQSEPITPRNTQSSGDEEELYLNLHNGPLVSQDVVTAADGSFQFKFTIKWEELCQHPTALHIAFGETIAEHDLLVVAQLLPVNDAPQQLYHVQPPQSPAPLTSFARIPITHSPIRVISDVDDTVKLSGILLGARAVFHNVFVKDLTDNVIPGMGEWYTGMWKHGVRFHYVSNGPFEYLPVLNEFFAISKLPPGSIKLRSYAGRSLFSGLLSAPAARKRAGVVDVLDSFPGSRFFLIGDTGEQDLELYADLTRERPDQILAIFVRDADASTEPLEDPTGWNAIAIGAAGTRNNDRPLFRENSAASQSTSSLSINSFSKYNYSGAGSPLNPANVNLDSRRPNTPAKDKDLPPKYFSNNTLINEPELIDDMDTPTLASSSHMDPPNALQYPNRHRVAPTVTASRVSAKYVNQPPTPIDPPSISGSLGPQSSAASSRSQQTTSSASSSDSYGRKTSMISEAEKRRADLQLRVYRARTQMPGHIPLRVFRDPAECVEAQQILDRET